MLMLILISIFIFRRAHGVLEIFKMISGMITYFFFFSFHGKVYLPKGFRPGTKSAIPALAPGGY